METNDDDDAATKRSDAAKNVPAKVYLGGNARRAVASTTTNETATEDASPAAGEAEDVPLEFDRSTYKMYHSCQILYPCMSFDIIESSSPIAVNGHSTSKDVTFPIPSCYIVAGTQAEHANANRLLVMKMSNLTSLKQKKSSGKADNDDDDSSDTDSDDDDEDDDLPALEACEIRQRATINRVRMNFIDSKPFVACWYDNNKVSVWDVQQQINTLNDPRAMQQYKQDDRNRKPVFTFHGHKTEGFAMDWSPVNKACLATGACDGAIHVWKPSENDWYVDEKPLRITNESIEDLQWSPTEANVLASASCDKSLRIWDIRQQHGPKGGCMLTRADAHDADVNVISWNRVQTHLLLSGGDDGVIKVWDLRKFGSSNAADATLAAFKFHTGPITSLEWCPHDASVFAASSEDDRLSQWDISVERDSEMTDAADAAGSVSVGDDSDEKVLAGLPPQLLFVHCGQTEIKELHWHKQYAGVLLSTAQEGVDIFKTISV